MKYLCILAAVTLLGQGPRVAPTEIESGTVAPLADSDWPVLVPVYEDFAFDTGDGPTLTIMGPGNRTKPLVTINASGQVKPGGGMTLPIEHNTDDCTCSDDIELHTCPYECEINENYDDVCRCCPHCETECGDNI